MELGVEVSAPRDADELLSRLRALGLRRTQHCVLTRNRTVMVSFGDGELRIHQGYLSAPEPVLRAIVTFVQGRTRAERRAAQRIILAAAVVSPAASRLSERTHPDDALMVDRLRALHAQLNAERFAGALRTVPIRVSRRMKSRLGHYVPASQSVPVEIVISRRHIRRDGWDDATDTLLHEMVHQWQDESGLPVDHRGEFKRKARDVGAAPVAKKVVERVPLRRRAG